MTDLMKVRGDWHPENLACGLTAAPGEPFEASLLTEDDQRLLDEGIVIGAHVTPVPLEGEALQDRAKALKITGRTSMSADELRQAVALAESNTTPAKGTEPAAQRMGG